MSHGEYARCERVLEIIVRDICFINPRYSIETYAKAARTRRLSLLVVRLIPCVTAVVVW